MKLDEQLKKSDQTFCGYIAKNLPQKSDKNSDVWGFIGKNIAQSINSSSLHKHKPFL